MYTDEKQELIEVTDQIINILLTIEHHSYALTPEVQVNLLRNLHHLKQAFTLLNFPKCVHELIHKNEVSLNRCEETHFIPQAIFNTLYDSIIQISEYLHKERLVESFEKIHKCSKCKSNPKEDMPQNCKNDSVNLHTTPTLKLDDHVKNQYKANSKTLLIANTYDSCLIGQQLRNYQHDHDKINCIKDLSRLGKELWKYEIIIIDTDNSTAPFFLSLRVINTVHKKANIIACGENKDTSYAHDFSDIAYFWLGKKSTHFSSQFGRILLQMQTQLPEKKKVTF